ncbi:MAG: nitrogenase iron protein NifH [Clostridiales bacterium]|nr:nitrogenase iron protein NifH [Clostridiales bacterium]
MKKIAIYGKGGIGKSTIVSNVAVALAQQGFRVMQIGCDPKADSTIGLRHGEALPTVLATYREKKDEFALEEVAGIGYAGVVCMEAGGPLPGVGCAGRGIITALEKIEAKGIYEKYQPDVVFYDVLGDVVCGGFSMPMRSGYADEVYIVTSGENMSIYAAANIATAVTNFAGRGYAKLGGIILNQRNARDEKRKVRELCGDFHTDIAGEIPFSQLVQDAEERNMTLIEMEPESDVAEAFRGLAKRFYVKETWTE